MTDKRCATCRHWDPPVGGRDFCWDDEGKQHELPQRACGRIVSPERLTVGDAERPAFVSANFVGSLSTLPTFGCVLWTARAGGEEG